MDNKERLFDNFPPVTTREWMDKILSDLKGADFNRKMVWKPLRIRSKAVLHDGRHHRSAIYEHSAGEYPWLRGTKQGNDWYIRQDIEVSDYLQANRRAIYLLERGVNSLDLILLILNR